MANAEKTSSGAEKTSSGASEIDEKKMKRKLSNRESARRSRLKKQKLMQEKILEISTLERLIKENCERFRVLKLRLESVESENEFLRLEKTRLSSCVCDLENMMSTTTSLRLMQNGDNDEQNANAEIEVGDCRDREPWRLRCDSLQAMASSGMFRT